MSLAAPVPTLDRSAWDGIPDEEVVERVRAGETGLYEVVMRRYNQRLFRVALSILRDDAEAEDVMQEAYVNAYQHLDQFAGLAKFSTWLTRIAVNEALARLRRRERIGGESGPETHSIIMNTLTSGIPDPERQASDNQLRLVLESAIDSLPDMYRSVFMLRAVEGLSAAETAAFLDISEEAVKTRLHRSRHMLQKDLGRRATVLSGDAFPFHLSRCDQVVAGVFQKIGFGA